MPYSISKKGTCFQVVNTESGKVFAKCTTKEKAEAQIRLLRSKEKDVKESNLDKALRILSEDSSIFDAAIEEIADMTDNNEHSEALLAGAKFISGYDGEAEKLVDGFESVVSQHKRAGHLTKDIQSQREDLAKKLFKIAKKVLSPEEYKKFNGAY